MKQKRKILSLCMIFVANAAFSQFSAKISTYTPLNMQDSLHTSPILYKSVTPFSLLPGNFSTTQLGFFCKQELKFEAATKLPLKFRLGSVGYCDWLEGKRNAVPGK